MAGKTMTAEKVWMVYGKKMSMPTVKHYTLMSANDEAKRLASFNPGIEFYVLESISAYIAPVSSVRAVALVQGEEVPF